MQGNKALRKKHLQKGIEDKAKNVQMMPVGMVEAGPSSPLGLLGSRRGLQFPRRKEGDSDSHETWLSAPRTKVATPMLFSAGKARPKFLKVSKAGKELHVVCQESRGGKEEIHVGVSSGHRPYVKTERMLISTPNVTNCLSREREGPSVESRGAVQSRGGLAFSSGIRAAGAEGSPINRLNLQMVSIKRYGEEGMTSREHAAERLTSQKKLQSSSKIFPMLTHRRGTSGTTSVHDVLHNEVHDLKTSGADVVNTPSTGRASLYTEDMFNRHRSIEASRSNEETSRGHRQNLNFPQFPTWSSRRADEITYEDSKVPSLRELAMLRRELKTRQLLECMQTSPGGPTANEQEKRSIANKLSPDKGVLVASWMTHREFLSDKNLEVRDECKVPQGKGVSSKKVSFSHVGEEEETSNNVLHSNKTERQLQLQKTDRLSCSMIRSKRQEAELMLEQRPTTQGLCEDPDPDTTHKELLNNMKNRLSIYSRKKVHQSIEEANYYEPHIQASQRFKEELEQREDHCFEMLDNFKDFISDASRTKASSINQAFRDATALREAIEHELGHEERMHEVLLAKHQDGNDPNSMGCPLRSEISMRRGLKDVRENYPKFAHRGMAKTKAVLSIHCRNLRLHGNITSHPMVIAYEKDERCDDQTKSKNAEDDEGDEPLFAVLRNAGQEPGGVWLEAGRTEWIRSNNHPMFKENIEIAVHPNLLQIVKFRVFDVKDPQQLDVARGTGITKDLGQFESTLDSLLRNQDTSKSLSASKRGDGQDNDNYGNITVMAVERFGQVYASETSDDGDVCENEAANQPSEYPHSISSESKEESRDSFEKCSADLSSMDRNSGSPTLEDCVDDFAAVPHQASKRLHALLRTDSPQPQASQRVPRNVILRKPSKSQRLIACPARRPSSHAEISI
jgi:hypothetical protein